MRLGKATVVRRAMSVADLAEVPTESFHDLIPKETVENQGCSDGARWNNSD